MQLQPDNNVFSKVENSAIVIHAFSPNAVFLQYEACDSLERTINLVRHTQSNTIDDVGRGVQYDDLQLR